MTLLPLKVWCLCHAHVWALDPMPVPGDGGPYWRLEAHDRPDGTPCPPTIRRNECRPMTPAELEALPAEFLARVDDGEARP